MSVMLTDEDKPELLQKVLDTFPNVGCSAKRDQIVSASDILWCQKGGPAFR